MSVERDAKFAAQVIQKAADLTNRIQCIKLGDDKAATEGPAVTAILEGFFETICQLQEYQQDEGDPSYGPLHSDKTILPAWYGLIEASQALSEIPRNGTFLAARMSLFLMLAFGFQHTFPFDLELSDLSRERIKLYSKFSFALDELLLAQLRSIWVQNGQNEFFNWATTHLEFKEPNIRTEYNRAAVLAQSPEDLWKVPGMTGMQRWVPAPGDKPIFKSFSYATGAGFGEPDTIGGPQPIISQNLYSDGPIRWMSQFCLIADDDSEVWIPGPNLRRSRQFILDARVKIYPGLIKKRELLAITAMNQSGIPFEIRKMVLDLLETPKWHPHLSRLDIGNAYTPFPKPIEECRTSSACQGGLDGVDTALTCPTRRLVLWNLGLRCYHTFHKTAEGWKLCKRRGICEGHHDEDEWQLDDVEGLQSMVARVLEDQCGIDQTADGSWLEQMTTVDPHLGQLTASANALNAQISCMNGSFYGLDKEEHAADVSISGGISGLVHCMLHERVKAFGLHGELHMRMRLSSEWAWAEPEEDLDSAIVAVRGMHQACSGS